MTHEPLIAIIVPVHNGMPYLPEAIASILQQTLTRWQLHVVDDGSTDDTPYYLKSITDPRVCYHRLEKIGFSGALNYALAESMFSLVARMDADDIAEPTRLAEQYDYMTQHPDCVAVGCQSITIDAAGRGVGDRQFPQTDEAIRWQMAFGCPFQHPGVVYRHEAVRAAEQYRPEEYPADDYGLWIRMSRQGKLANLPSKLLRYRIHGTSITSTQTELQTRVCSQLAAKYATSILPAIDPTTFGELYHFVAAGTLPQVVSLANLTSAFRAWQRHFALARTAPSSDLAVWMARVASWVRWHCLRHASERRWSPWNAWKWLRLAGQFDARDGSLGSMARRWLHQRIKPGRKPALAD